MKKIYEVSNDEFSGRVVIIAETYETEVMIDERPEEAESDFILGRDHSYAMKSEKQTVYWVRAFYRYENGNEMLNRHCIYNQKAFTKKRGNELFNEAKLLTK